MNTWIALLRGINVGGANKLRMADLRALLEELGFADVRTYIQSGNCVFTADGRSADDLAVTIGAAIAERHAITCRVFVIGVDDFRGIATANPYLEDGHDPKTVHLMFLDGEPGSEALERAGEVLTNGERTHVNGKALYLHAPNGVGRSKFAGAPERFLGVAVTVRNLRTVNNLLELMEAET